MAKIARATQKQFGVDGNASYFGQPGSFDTTKTNTKDPAVIQALAAFTNGLQDIVPSGTYKVALEDLNSLFMLAFRQLAYIMQAGISEWDAGTTYYIGSIIQYGGLLYTSLQDDNLNKNPATQTSYWILGVNGDSAAGDFKTSAQTADHGRWLLCTPGGRTVSRSTYAGLFAIVGTKFGAGDGSTTFTLPNCEGGKIILPLSASDTDFNDIGKTGGEKTHILTTPEMPAHTHSTQVFPDPIGGGEGSDLRRGVYTGTTGSTGGGAAHNNMPPYVVGGNLFISFR